MGVLDSASSPSPEMEMYAVELVGSALDVRGHDFVVHRQSPNETLLPSANLRESIQKIITDNGWKVDTYHFGARVSAQDVKRNEFITLFNAVKDHYIVLSPPIFDRKGKVLRRGSLR